MFKPMREAIRKIVLSNVMKAGLYASRAFVCLFARVSFCPFSLPLGVGCWLRVVIVALPGFF